MMVIAMQSVMFITTSNHEHNIDKGEVYDVIWHNNSELDDSGYMSICTDFMKIDIPMTRITFEGYFKPYENHQNLYIKRFEMSFNNSKVYENKINSFIQNKNIKINQIFEPNSDTVDIWYTKEIGEWPNNKGNRSQKEND